MKECQEIARQAGLKFLPSTIAGFYFPNRPPISTVERYLIGNQEPHIRIAVKAFMVIRKKMISDKRKYGNNG
jgi:hypothetical protein